MLKQIISIQNEKEMGGGTEAMKIEKRQELEERDGKEREEPSVSERDG